MFTLKKTKSRPVGKVTLFQTFRPLYVLLSLLGLFPCSIKQKKTELVVIRKSVYINVLSAVSINVTICAFLALHIRHIFTAIEDNSFTSAIMTQLNYIFELINLVAFCSVAYICAYFNRSKYVELLIFVSTCTDSSENSDKILKLLRFNINVVIIGILLISSALQVCINFTRQDSIWKIVLVTFTFNLPQMIQFVTISFYYALVLMILTLLNIVKEQMYSFIRPKSIKDGFMTVEPKHQATLRDIERLYVKTFEMKRDVNKAFEAPILIALIQCFHSMVSECHIIYHGVINKNLSAHEITNCTVWVFYQILKVYALANSGSLLKIETMKIGRLLHNIPTEKQDLRFLIEIQHFTTLMTYQASPLTVYGYFPLDSTLLFKMIASATMYLIILVQFDK